jgi:hypothetical protein
MERMAALCFQLDCQPDFALRAFGQVICWDRGRPARNEREARKIDSENLRACGVFAGGTPAVPTNHLSAPAACFSNVS